MGWQEQENKWYFYKGDEKVLGWYEENRKYFHLNDKDGSLDTGWFQTATDNDLWFYGYPETMVVDGKQVYKGEMAVGWLQIDNKWFYLYEESDASQAQYKGACAINCTLTINGKKQSFDEHGVWIENTAGSVSDKGIDFIKSWEGFYPNKYYDCVGVLTQGYGLTGAEIQNLPDRITEAEATRLLKDWIERKYAPPIKSDLEKRGVHLKQQEFDALVSFAYNCGVGGLLGSTLYKNVCAGVRDTDTITANFRAWSNGGGKRIEGLYRRRTKEAAMFLRGDYTGNC